MAAILLTAAISMGTGDITPHLGTWPHRETGDITPHLGTWPHHETSKPQRLTARIHCGRRCRMRRAVAPYDRKLDRMARCESGGRWHINTGNGFSGGLQFLPSTWRSVGGRGLPHQASELEQKYRAVLLIRQQGYAPWPVCGYV